MAARARAPGGGQGPDPAARERYLPAERLAAGLRHVRAASRSEDGAATGRISWAIRTTSMHFSPFSVSGPPHKGERRYDSSHSSTFTWERATALECRRFSALPVRPSAL